MKKKKWLAGVLCAAVAVGAAAGIYGGVRAAVGKVVMVVNASELNQGFYSDSMYMQGMVTSDVSQEIYLQDTETVARVLVKEGDAVQEGDVLMEYDTNQTTLNLEKEKLSREMISLNIQAAEKNIQTLKNMKPVPESPGIDPGDDFQGGDSYYEPEIPEEPEAGETPAPTENPARSFTVRLSGNGQGNQKFPEILIPSGTSLREYLDGLRQEEWKQYVPSAAGCVFGGWYTDEQCTKPYDLDTPVTGDITLYARWFRQYQAVALKELTETAVPYNRPAEGEPEAGTLVNPYRYLAEDGAVVYPSFMNSVKEEAREALKKNPKAHIYFTLEVYEENRLSGKLAGFYMQDAVKLVEQEFPENWRGVLDARSGSLEDTYLAPTGGPAPEPTEIPASAASLKMSGGPAVLTAADGNVGAESSLGLIPSDREYTKEELDAALREQEERLAGLELDLKESDLKIKSAEKAVSEGSVRAKINGVVKKAGDPENPPGDGSAFLRVTSTEGMYIRGGLSELMLDQVHEGDMLDVMAWESGTSCQAEIREISPYPDESGMFRGYSAASASFYPFVAYVAEGGESLISQEWVELNLGADSMSGSPDALYLWKAFILEEDGRKFVYLRDEGGKLKKQEIVTGRRSGEGYEVLSGITWDDWLAFPYGKEVRSGARTREGDMSELYGN